MKWVFLFNEPRPLHAHILEERPFGGGIAAIIHLAEALEALGEEVFVLTCLEDLPPSRPCYITWEQLSDIGPVDVLLAVRGWNRLIDFPLPHKKCYFWTGDTAYNPKTMGLGDPRVVAVLNAFIAKSHWQMVSLCKASGFPLNKSWVLPNGVPLNYFAGTEQRRRKRLIYASTPYRGLQFLPKIFRALKERHPELELFVYSSHDRLSVEWPPSPEDDLPYRDLFNELSRLPDCHVSSSILQRALARELMKSTVLVYPTHFEETCANVTLEAQAAGCPIVTSDLASLPETVGDAGIMVEGKPGTESYDTRFIEAVDLLLTDDAYFQALSRKGLERVKSFDWKKRAQELLGHISQELR